MSAVLKPVPADPEQFFVPSVTELKSRPRRLPLWLKLLVIAQHGSTAIAGSLVAAVLVTYSSTVYIDKAVFRAARELEALQVETQQITTTNETLKHTLAEAAAQSTRFRLSQPAQTLFLTPAPPRVHPVAEGSPAETPAAGSVGRTAQPAPPADPAAMPSPLGY